LQLEERLVKTGQLPGGLDQNDPLRLYLEEIAGIPAAGDLAVLAEQLAQGNDTVITSLVNLMLSRVVETAKEYMGRGVYLLDLIQEASLGLWQGIQDYTGGDFEEHCMWWIRQFLAGAVTLQARSAGIGQKLRQAAEDYRAVDEKLLAELGRNPTTEEIAEGLHMSPEETEVVAEMLESARLSQRVRQPEPEQLPQEEDQAVEDTAYFRMRQRIEELLSDLSEEDARLLSLRYGLEGGLPMDAVQVAAQLGLTPQEVNNREAAALAKLRSNNERGN
jgi:RNA polymerase primary sigma factor